MLTLLSLKKSKAVLRNRIDADFRAGKQTNLDTLLAYQHISCRLKFVEDRLLCKAEN